MLAGLPILFLPFDPQNTRRQLWARHLATLLYGIVGRAGRAGCREEQTGGLQFTLWKLRAAGGSSANGSQHLLSHLGVLG